MTRIEVDVKIEFKSDVSEGASITQFFISESCKSVFNKSNRINVFSNSYGNDNGSRPRSSGTPPIIIGISNSSPTSTPGEKVNSSTTSTDVYENNETNINNNVLELVLNQISLLTDISITL